MGSILLDYTASEEKLKSDFYGLWTLRHSCSGRPLTLDETDQRISPEGTSHTYGPLRNGRTRGFFQVEFNDDGSRNTWDMISQEARQEIPTAPVRVPSQGSNSYTIVNVDTAVGKILFRLPGMGAKNHLVLQLKCIRNHTHELIMISGSGKNSHWNKFCREGEELISIYTKVPTT